MRTFKPIHAALVAAALTLAPELGATGSPGASTLFVTNSNDGGPGSLRRQIQIANANLGVHDVICFNIPGPGVHTIILLSPLPPLTDWAGVTIDGFSQPGASPGPNPPSTATLLVELDGSQLTIGDGLTAESDDNVIRGLVINRCPWDGIRVLAGRSNTTASRNVIFANFIGTDPSGTIDLGNGRLPAPPPPLPALLAGAHVHNTAGGTSLDCVIEGNLVSGNTHEGIWIAGPMIPGDVAFHDVLNNYVGTDITGFVDRGNDRVGVVLTEGTHDNEIVDNLISGNDWDGVSISGYVPDGIQTYDNLVFDNIIGADIALAPLPNTRQGVAIGQYGPNAVGAADNNVIRQNVIAFNGLNGVVVTGPGFVEENTITINAIWDNGGLGIDLNNDYVTTNDPLDADLGPNRLLNFPVFDPALTNYSLGVTTIGGTLTIDSDPRTATIEVFYAVPDPSGHGEGQWFLGSTSPVDTAGNWTFTTQKLSRGHVVTATATDVSGNTSEFASNHVIPGIPSLVASAPTLPARLGGLNFLLLNAPAHPNKQYVMAGSLSGVTPPTVVNGVTVPLVFDDFTNLTLLAPFPPMFLNFVGNLDASGQAAAALSSAPLPPSAIGTVMHFAYMVEPYNSFASDPAAIEVVWW